MMKEPIRIVDLDSTISDDSWRLWMINPEEEDGDNKYHSYHVHCDRDEPINRYIVDESPCPVVFVTARPEYMREKTVQWLYKFGFNFYALLMRPNGNHESSVELKRGVLSTLKSFYPIEKAYDDREDIIAMYNSNGVKGILV